MLSSRDSNGIAQTDLQNYVLIVRSLARRITRVFVFRRRFRVPQYTISSHGRHLNVFFSGGCKICAEETVVPWDNSPLGQKAVYGHVKFVRIKSLWEILSLVPVITQIK